MLVLGSELDLERPPRDDRLSLESRYPAGEPGVGIQRQRRPAQAVQDACVQRHRPGLGNGVEALSQGDLHSPPGLGHPLVGKHDVPAAILRPVVVGERGEAEPPQLLARSRRGAVRATVVGDPHQRQEAVRRFAYVECPLSVEQGFGGEVHQDQARVHAVRQAGLAGRDKRQADVAVDPAEFRSHDLAVGKRHRGQERRQVEHLLLRRPAPVRGVLFVPPWRRGDLAVQPGSKPVPAKLAGDPVQSRARSSCDHVGSRSELEDDPALCVDAGRPLRVEESPVGIR